VRAGQAFRVGSLLAHHDGQSGRSLPSPVRRFATSGSSANIELVTKVLDACTTFDRFWVFAGGLTNVEVELRVTDGDTGAVRTYRSPLDQPFRPPGHERLPHLR
jgi:hypothetical protein